ncbi:MAG: pyrimidine-nucleoside phosphorylase [bacterium]|jgi:pyrimidine-nucleoside phosphorylase|nr:pyrimidine-nucleoside phosphorylase [Bacillota bacterium]
MRALDIIAKKRDGRELTAVEIEFLINGYVAGDIPDYQMAAFLMGTYIRGMTKAETAALTMAMAKSGDVLDLSSIPGIKVDKHSTGGVGDKTTLVVGPLVAAAGVPVAKMSGRGLGHSGGTIDKLESIPGFRVELQEAEFLTNVHWIGLVVSGQTGNLAPADKKIYALRDVTATVASIPLIASSIMSKKIAAGADAIVLDVKCGSGAFMVDLQSAQALAQAMVDIGTSVGRQTVAVISNMDQPLGTAVGNALEVKEAIATLQNKGPADLTALALTLGAHMLTLAGRTGSVDEGERVLQELLTTGAAWEKFREFVAAQGGDLKAVDHELLPQAQFKLPVPAPSSGYVARLVADKIGQASMALGAGRQRKEDVIDLAVGIVVQGKVGDKVHQGDLLAEVHTNDSVRGRAAVSEVLSAYTIVPEPVSAPPLICQVIR